MAFAYHRHDPCASCCKSCSACVNGMPTPLLVTFSGFAGPTACCTDLNTLFALSVQAGSGTMSYGGTTTCQRAYYFGNTDPCWNFLLSGVQSQTVDGAIQYRVIVELYGGGAGYGGNGLFFATRWFDAKDFDCGAFDEEPLTLVGIYAPWLLHAAGTCDVGAGYDGVGVTCTISSRATEP